MPLFMRSKPFNSLHLIIAISLTVAAMPLRAGAATFAARISPPNFELKAKPGEVLRRAIADTNMDTIVGPINYNNENYCRTPLVGGQWVKGDKYPWKINIVYNKQHPGIPTNGTFKAIG